MITKSLTESSQVGGNAISIFSAGGGAEIARCLDYKWRTFPYPIFLRTNFFRGAKRVTINRLATNDEKKTENTLHVTEFRFTPSNTTLRDAKTDCTAAPREALKALQGAQSLHRQKHYWRSFAHRFLHSPYVIVVTHIYISIKHGFHFLKTWAPRQAHHLHPLLLIIVLSHVYISSTKTNVKTNTR